MEALKQGSDALFILLGGIMVGSLQRGMTMGDAVKTYSVLTIGDGLIAQIPALFIAICAGMIVTRVQSGDGPSNVGKDIGQQVMAHLGIGPGREIGEALAQSLGIERSDVVAHAWCDNGPKWRGLLLRSAQQVLALKPDAAVLQGLFVGVVPVALGMLFYPALRAGGARMLAFALALTAPLSPASAKPASPSGA